MRDKCLLALLPWLLAGGPACTRFSADDSRSDGGPGPSTATRDLEVVVDWPTLDALDPTRDGRAASIRALVTDAANPIARFAHAGDPSDRGPWAFRAATTSGRVDVTIEVRAADERLLGWGEVRGWDVDARTTINVAARARILYFTSRDRDDGQLRALDLAPPDLAEPGVGESLDELPSLAFPTGLYVTLDGRSLVQSGVDRASQKPRFQVIATSSHAITGNGDLPFASAGIVPIGDGSRMLVAPEKGAGSAAFAEVDVRAGTSKPLATDLKGGELAVTALARDATGARAVAVGMYDSGAESKPYLFVYDGTRIVTRELGSVVQYVGGVRFAPDGRRLIVAGATETADWSTGKIFALDLATVAAGPASPIVSLADGRSRPSSMLLDPDGRFAFVTNEIHYLGGAGACCGEMNIVDLDTASTVFTGSASGNFAEFEITEAIRLPYAPALAIGGQSDNGNNVNGPLVELRRGERPVKISVRTRADVGSMHGMATPFGQRL